MIPLRFRKELRAFDRGLELHWNGAPGHHHWMLYRVDQRGGASTEDILFKEVSLCGPRSAYRELGLWVFQMLRKRALSRYHPEPEKQTEAFCDVLEKEDEDRELSVLKEASDLAADMRKHKDWAKRGRASVTIENAPTE